MNPIDTKDGCKPCPRMNQGVCFLPLVWLLLAGWVSEAAARPPNVLVVLTDDQGWGDLGWHGNTNLATPNLDALAREGAAFERFYVSPVCSPTRAEFLTGRWHPRGGIYGTSAGGELLDLDETTLAEIFRSVGYATGAFGKWHNGMQYPYHPLGRGFEQFYGFCSGHWGDYFSPPLERDGELVQGRGYVIDDFTEEAMAFMEAHRGEPFFCYVPYNTPHSPMQVPDRFYEKFAGTKLGMKHKEPERENEEHTRAALAMCENIDWNVGRLLRKLEALGLEQDTIVAFFCDNGPNGFRWNGGMKGRKGSTDEGGVRSPLFIRWPGHIRAGRKVPQLGAAIDLFPTLIDLAGITWAPSNDDAWDGMSLKPWLTSDDAPRDRLIFSHWNDRVSVRTQRYLLDHQGQLFDLADDHGQRHNVAADHAGIVRRLTHAVETWKADVLRDYPRRGRPFPVGHPGMKTTLLPARDATARGNVRRSNRFPNCSYFEHWTSLDDALVWNVEVVAGGTFEVELHYACPKSDVGSVMELSFGDDRCEGRVTAAHDPPVAGGENDRVPRQESYVKDFRPMTLGTIRLSAGLGQLTLRALEIPGAQAMEFRRLVLSRLPE